MVGTHLHLRVRKVPSWRIVTPPPATEINAKKNGCFPSFTRQNLAAGHMGNEYGFLVSWQKLQRDLPLEPNIAPKARLPDFSQQNQGMLNTTMRSCVSCVATASEIYRISSCQIAEEKTHRRCCWCCCA